MSDKKEIDLSLAFKDAFLPGETVTISLVFEQNYVGGKPPHCPRCSKTSKAATNVDVLWYVKRHSLIFFY